MRLETRDWRLENRKRMRRFFPVSSLKSPVSSSRGFTLVEVLVGTALFLIVSLSAYGAFVSLFKLINLAQYQEMAINVANEEMEIIRNMPYVDVGVQGSIPSGSVPYQQTLTRGGIPFLITAIIRNIDLPADGVAGGSPNDTNPADNKLISLTISCSSCADTKPLTVTGQVAPLALENTGNTGSIFIHVNDATGKPVQGAAVTVTNTLASLTVNDVTDDTGILALVGVPPGTGAYHTVATKASYSTDQTGNTNNPDSNVLTGQVSDVFLFIDELSSFAVTSVSPTCQVIPNFDFHMTGSKETAPGIPKYSANLATDAGGSLTLSPMEYDTGGYLVTPNDVTYDLAGVNPVNRVVLNPGSVSNLQLVAVPKVAGSSLLVSVVDGAGLPLPDATVILQQGGSTLSTKITGNGSISQSDWSGGDGQITYDPVTNRYASSANMNDAGGDIKLSGIFGFAGSGYLISSTFDTGTTSQFRTLQWTPSVQASGSTSAIFRFETSPDPDPAGGWQFAGADYSIPGSLSVSNGRYARYQVSFTSNDPNYTPTISDVSFTYTSDCLPPGQVLFQGLSTGTYSVTVSKTGYTDTVHDPLVVGTGWQESKEILSP